MFGSTKTALLIIFVLGLAVAGFGVSSYNRLVRLDQAVQSQWSQVENVYQRRSDLVPNLVETVKGAAKFEKDTFTAVTEARARVGQVQLGAAGAPPTDPAALAKFQQAQDQLSSALSRLLVVAESYPDLKATASFRDLQVQLEGAENRITVERMRFGEAAQAFNATRDSFPTTVVAGLFGARFAEKAYFHAAAGAEAAPRVHF
jgi:LemA protein